MPAAINLASKNKVQPPKGGKGPPHEPSCCMRAPPRRARLVVLVALIIVAALAVHSCALRRSREGFLSVLHITSRERIILVNDPATAPVPADVLLACGSLAALQARGIMQVRKDAPPKLPSAGSVIVRVSDLATLWRKQRSGARRQASGSRPLLLAALEDAPVGATAPRLLLLCAHSAHAPPDVQSLAAAVAEGGARVCSSGATASLMLQALCRVHGMQDGSLGPHRVLDAQGLVEQVRAVLAGRGGPLEVLALWCSPASDVMTAAADAGPVTLVQYEQRDGNQDAMQRLSALAPPARWLATDIRELLPLSPSAAADRRMQSLLSAPLVLSAHEHGSNRDVADLLRLELLRAAVIEANSGRGGAVASCNAARLALGSAPGSGNDLTTHPALSALLEAENARFAVRSHLTGDALSVGAPNIPVLEQFSVAGPAPAVELSLHSLPPGAQVQVTANGLQRVMHLPGDRVQGVILRVGDRVHIVGRPVFTVVRVAHAPGPAARLECPVMVRVREERALLGGQDAGERIRVRAPAAPLLRSGDQVLLTWSDRASPRPGSVLAITERDMDVELQPAANQDDEDKFHPLSVCSTDPAVLNKEMCELERGGVWDRPCESDAECPFFGGNEGDRGGCGRGGFCELPLGATAVGYRRWAGTPMCGDPKGQLGAAPCDRHLRRPVFPMVPS